MKHLPILLVGLLILPGVRADELAVYPIPAGIATNATFAVKVRTPGAEWQEVSCYAVEVDMRHPRSSSMAYFDFTGAVEVAVTYQRGDVRTARIRPLSYGLKPEVTGNTLAFTLKEPRNLSIEVNDDIYDNLQLFAGPIEAARPDPQNPDVIYFGPGVHTPGPVFNIASGKTVYLAGGAVVKTRLACDHAEHVRICGRGVLYQPIEGIAVQFSHDVAISGITIVNPRYYSVKGGQSTGLTIRNLKSFSSKGWGDGIDTMSCSDVLIDGVYMRNADDCIAIYGHRGEYTGDARNITVQHATLWADVAHPINIGTHGNPAQPEVLENLTFTDIDVLEHNEPQVNYQGCIAINVSDENLVRNVRVDGLRIEEFTLGQLVNLRVAYNKKYATAPGRGIENITFKDVCYTGTRANLSIITGYDDTRRVSGIIFENLLINGTVMRTADAARIFIGEHVTGVEFRATGTAPAAAKP